MIKYFFSTPYKLYLFKRIYMASRTNFNPSKHFSNSAPEKVNFPLEE
jgi:hypothetical protein